MTTSPEANAVRLASQSAPYAFLRRCIFCGRSDIHTHRHTPTEKRDESGTGWDESGTTRDPVLARIHLAAEQPAPGRTQAVRKARLGGMFDPAVSDR
jgi:hypothetical protein